MNTHVYEHDTSFLLWYDISINKTSFAGNAQVRSLIAFRGVFQVLEVLSSRY